MYAGRGTGPHCVSDQSRPDNPRLAAVLRAASPMLMDQTYDWAGNYRHPTRWNQHFPPLSLPQMLAHSATRTPEAALIDFYGRHYSYAQVERAADRFACGLKRIGIKRGDRVGLFLPNVPHYLAAYYGITRLGAIVVNLSPLYSVEELRHQIDDSGTRAVVTLDAKALLPTALEVMRQSAIEKLIVGSIAGALPAAKSVLYRLFNRNDIVDRPDDKRLCRFSDLLANDGGCPLEDIDPERDIAVIQYTGGTTGMPKGAMLTHQNLTANARQIASVDPHGGEADRIIGVLPLFHVFANSCVLNRTVHLGGEIVMLPRFDAGQVLAAINRTKPTSMPGVPTMYQALLDHPRLGKTDFHSLRVCTTGGAPMAVELKRKFEEATNAVVTEGYGLTEAAGVVTVNPYEGLNKAGTVGQPLPGTTVVLMDRENPDTPAPPGEPGEITFAGPQAMRGYWNRPAEDAKIFVDGRLRTGDVGIIDADGYLSIVDRLKDMISVGGFKVFPSQIETVLYRNAAVREALVIGIPDAYLGERPKAFVTLANGAAITGDELMGWLNPQLGKHERVIAVEVRNALPKTMVGKLSRKELVDEERQKPRPSQA